MQAFLVTMHAVFTFYANRGFQVGGVPVSYHWRELPQVSFLSRQTFCRDKHVRQNMSFISTKICLSRQTYFCGDKSFVATNIILSRQK